MAFGRPTRRVNIGPLTIGGDTLIRVQSMTNVHTHDIDRCVAQITRLADRGCEIIRVSVPTSADTAVLPEILRQISLPLVADVHFHYGRALEAIEAGVHKIRLNPGNISDRRQVRQVIDACKANDVAIRIGVNQGSIRQPDDPDEKTEPLAELMARKLAQYVRIFEEASFGNLVLSAKCHDAAGTIAVNRLISSTYDYPLHLGVTHAGTIQTGAVRSATAIGTLLAEGIGNTIRVSLAGDPVAELEVAWEILTSLKLRPRTTPELIACPTCGRTEIDLLDMVNKVSEALKQINQPITVAVMGCVVNGPGEAQNADIALCGGRNKTFIYRKGKKIATTTPENAVNTLLEQIKLFIAEQKEQSVTQDY